MLVVVQVVLAIGKLYIRYISLIIHAYSLCAWLMSSDFDNEGCS